MRASETIASLVLTRSLPVKFSANGMNQIRDLPIIQVQDKAIKVLGPADIKNGDMVMIK